jgi:hypothetical protein
MAKMKFDRSKPYVNIGDDRARRSWQDDVTAVVTKVLGDKQSA